MIATAADALAVADAARIASLEEELLLTRERARSEGDELEGLRRQLRAKELAHKEATAAERHARAELATATSSAKDLEDLVGAVREELRATELGLQAEREARVAAGERAAELQRQLGEATTRLAQAAANETAAKEAAAAADSARQLAESDAERARRDAEAAAEAREGAAREAAATGERQAGELGVQLAAAQDLARTQAAELVRLREDMCDSLCVFWGLLFFAHRAATLRIDAHSPLAVIPTDDPVVVRAAAGGRRRPSCSRAVSGLTRPTYATAISEPTALPCGERPCRVLPAPGPPSDGLRLAVVRRRRCSRRRRRPRRSSRASWARRRTRCGRAHCSSVCGASRRRRS